MGKILWSVDFEEIHCENGIRYETGGWAVGETGKPVRQKLLADGRAVPGEDPGAGYERYPGIIL